MSAKTTDLQRREVLFSGRVQGVGFRYTTRSIANRFAVAGFVRNRTDGRVEVVVEGSGTEIQQFLDAVAEARADFISDVKSTIAEPTREFTSFEIRF